MLFVSFKPKIPKNYSFFCLMSESNKQNLQDRSYDLRFFHYKLRTSFKNNLSPVQGESLPYWFGKLLWLCLF